jgi:hypothetical protein
MVLFYAWAWLRQVRASEGFLIAAGILFSVVGPDTFDWSSLQSPQPLVAGAVAAGLLVQAVRLGSTWRAIAGGAMVAVGLPILLQRLSVADSWFWQWHAPLAAFLLMTAVFNDDLAKELRELAWRGTPLMALAAAIIYPWTMPGLDPIVLFSYLIALLLVSGALWLRMREAQPLGAVFMTFAANLSLQAEHGYMLLAQSPLAGGRAWLACGLMLVLGAVWISLLKMGIWPLAWQCLERINISLRGTGPHQDPS